MLNKKIHDFYPNQGPNCLKNASLSRGPKIDNAALVTNGGDAGYGLLFSSVVVLTTFVTYSVLEPNLNDSLLFF